MEPRPYEKQLGISGNCVRVWRCLRGEYGTPAVVFRQSGWWGHTDVSDLTGCPDDYCKTNLLARECPGVIERAYMDRKTGRIYAVDKSKKDGREDARKKCAKPIALFRPSREHDPLSAYAAPVAEVGEQLTLV